MAAISNDWLAPLSGEFRKPYYKKLYETAESYEKGSAGKLVCEC
mgnify:CR=1 FL=1